MATAGAATRAELSEAADLAALQNFKPHPGNLVCDLPVSACKVLFVPCAGSYQLAFVPDPREERGLAPGHVERVAEQFKNCRGWEICRVRPGNAQQADFDEVKRAYASRDAEVPAAPTLEEGRRLAAFENRVLRDVEFIEEIRDGDAAKNIPPASRYDITVHTLPSGCDVLLIPATRGHQLVFVGMGAEQKHVAGVESKLMNPAGSECVFVKLASAQAVEVRRLQLAMETREQRARRSASELMGLLAGPELAPSKITSPLTRAKDAPSVEDDSFDV
jgi:hypothetical protein